VRIRVSVGFKFRIRVSHPMSATHANSASQIWARPTFLWEGCGPQDMMGWGFSPP